LKDTEYEAYKVIEDQIGYVDTLALTAIENASYDLINLVDAVSNGLYNPQDPNTELSVQTTNQEGV
jgi:hypothetical protein